MTIAYDLPAFEFSTETFVSQTPKFFVPNAIELVDPSFEFSTSAFVNQASKFFAPNSIAYDLPAFEFSTEVYFLSNRINAPIFIPGTIELNPSVLFYGEPEATKEIVFFSSTVAPEVFPIVDEEEAIEILYPIVPTPIVNKSVHQTDNKEWKRITKSVINQIYATLKLRVHKNRIQSVISFIKDNRSTLITLNTPGVYPFGNSYIRSTAYIVSFTKPYFEKPNYWRIDITYLQVQGLA